MSNIFKDDLTYESDKVKGLHELANRLTEEISEKDNNCQSQKLVNKELINRINRLEAQLHSK